MNLTKLFEMQRELDERIIEQHGLQGEDLLPKKILALQVELGELAQEWRGFKFWSKDQQPRYEKKSIAFADPGGPFEYITYLLQLVETQAKALDEAEGMSKRWEKAFVNADKQYLKMEKQAAELRRKLEALT